MTEYRLCLSMMVSLKLGKTLQAVNESLREICPLYSATELGCCSDDSLVFVKALLDPIKEVIVIYNSIMNRGEDIILDVLLFEKQSFVDPVNLEVGFQQIIDYDARIVSGWFDMPPDYRLPLVWFALRTLPH